MKRRESDRDLRGGGRAVVRKDRDKVFRRGVFLASAGDGEMRGRFGSGRQAGRESAAKNETDRGSPWPAAGAPPPQRPGPAKRPALPRVTCAGCLPARDGISRTADTS